MNPNGQNKSKIIEELVEDKEAGIEKKNNNDSIPHIPQVEIFGEDDNEMRFPTKVRFAGGEVIDVLQVDPYRNFPAKELKSWVGGLERLYDLSALTDQTKKQMLTGARLNKDAYCTDQYLRLLTKPPLIENSGGITAIAYHAAFYCGIEDIQATQGYALLYDIQGNLLHKIADKKDGFYDIRLSSDGKYLMQKYGYDFGEGGDGQLEEGFKFYDTGSGDMIFEWRLGKDRHLGGYDMFFDTNIALVFRREFPFHSQYYIDLENKTIYMKKMNLQEYSNNPEYRKELIPLFSKSRKISDLLKDGFIKIN